MAKKVKCIRDREGHLVLDKLYEVEWEDDDFYYLVGRVSDLDGWQKDRFVIVDEVEVVHVGTPAESSDTTDAPTAPPFDFDAYNGLKGW